MRRGEAFLDPEDANVAIEYAMYEQRQAEITRSSPALIVGLVIGLFVAFVLLLGYQPGMGAERALFTMSVATVAFLAFAGRENQRFATTRPG